MTSETSIENIKAHHLSGCDVLYTNIQLVAMKKSKKYKKKI